MIPKVATHILHHTSRAAAAAQNYTLRNVLGLQTSNTPSSSQGGLSGWSGVGSSGWGPGTGPGAKHNAGSRFYTGYTASSRLITQANSTAAQDTSLQTDDSEENKLRLIPRLSLVHSKPRPRRRSISFGTHDQSDRAEALGALKSVQFHQVRGRHVLAEQMPISSDLIVPATALDITPPPSSPRTLVRRNSTSTSSVDGDLTISSTDIPPPPLSSPQFATATLPPTDPSAPQTTLPPTPPPSDEESSYSFDTEAQRNVANAKSTGDMNTVVEAVKAMRESGEKLTARDFGYALYCLSATRTRGHSISFILETYNDMISRDLVPDFRAYRSMIETLAVRDNEVNKVIASLEQRIKRRQLCNRAESSLQEADLNRIAQLKTEDAFTSAKALFETASQIYTRTSFPSSVYVNLLRSCAVVGDVDSAIRIFGHLEGTFGKTSVNVYFQLMRTFVKANDLEGAKQVFDEYRAAAKEGRLVPAHVLDQPRDETTNYNQISSASNNDSDRFVQLLIWNKMIETYFLAGQPEQAIGVLEQMLDLNGGVKCLANEIPPPATSTYSTFITGFLNSGDIGSAVAWFDRMLQQTHRPITHPLVPILYPARPDRLSWAMILEGLARQGMVEDLNRLFHIYRTDAVTDGIHVRAVDRTLVYEANHAYLMKTPDISLEKLNKTIDFLIKEVFELNASQPNEAAMGMDDIRVTMERFLILLGHHKLYDRSLDVLEAYIATEKDWMAKNPEAAEQTLGQIFGTAGLRNLILSQTTTLLDRQNTPADEWPSIEFMMRFAELSREVGLSVGPRVSPYYLNIYYKAKEKGTIPSNMSIECWSVIIYSALTMERALALPDSLQPRYYPEGFEYQGLRALLEDFNRLKVTPKNFNMSPLLKMYTVLYEKFGGDTESIVEATAGPVWLKDLQKYAGRRLSDTQIAENPPVVTPPAHAPLVHNIDLYQGRFVDEWTPVTSKVTVESALRRYESGKKRGKYPPPEVVGRLINAFGRRGRLDIVQDLYTDAQGILAALEHDKKWQATAWFIVEDHMITALAQAGDVENAHVHRERILAQGGVPTGEAYGSLIHSVKETTDDSSTALTLWYEAEARGVMPNVYMYNTMISKLSKARKADFALELFEQMKHNGLRPTSVTYGAVISACCRVGDADSAEVLFQEMTLQQNFKPRHPPFNTMIQLYTQVKPNREKVLYYYHALLKAGVKPTVHTYKLLLDCHGSIEPVDTDAMQDVFEKIVNASDMHVEGVHWASLINAWGCAKKNLAKAQEIFESIPTHRSTVSSPNVLPDAVTYEAMFNVLVTLRRPDLISMYLDRLRSSGIHMTAYIANLLIKGFALSNELDKAREIFEGMQDTPVGVAAPGNHIVHESGDRKVLSPEAPVYREPSTWEAMFRAELGSGNKDKALELLERIKARQFPPAVFHRISGIMHDDLPVEY